MPPASYHPSSDKRFLRHSATFLLVLLIHLLMLLVLLRLAPPGSILPKESRLLAFQILPEPPQTPSRRPTKAKKTSGGAASRAPTAKPVPAPAPPAATPKPATELNIIPMSRSDFAASDISRMPSHSSGAVAGPSLAGVGQGNGEDDGPGEGPGGEKLYNAEWYREPSHAELAYYLPANAPRTGWGMIACQTVEKFHVDNCHEIGQSPPGSGLSRAIRQAAWQFLVRPPSLGGKPMVGAWVRIRIDFTEGVGTAR